MLAASSGSLDAALKYVIKPLTMSWAVGEATVVQADARTRDYSGFVVSTDPPYYSNIGYADLSDFFYVWLRRVLRDAHPDLFGTVLTPKLEELIASPQRHGGSASAERHFEDGFRQVFTAMRLSAGNDTPITVYYAFKQQERKASDILSTGWATILEAMLAAGWRITATWPLLTELDKRLVASGANALASSIVLVLRPRNADEPVISRRDFIRALRAELPAALTELQQGAIAPVDLAQATIGPGMAVYSRYSRVIESDGSSLSVKSALSLVNQALDELLAEQDGDLDADSRFCLRWYKQFGWKRGDYGIAESMGNALNIPVKRLEHGGVLTAREGSVRLLRPSELPRKWDPAKDDRISVWEVTCHLARAVTTEGTEAAARLMAKANTRVNLEAVQLLAYRLYELAQHKDPEDAGLFNALASEWAPLSAAAQRVDTRGMQGGLDLDAL
ncbi:hypothetical protein [Actinotalea sp. Marseille-Q4924]|uniref:hypothetical protein n=1 Tax=Actinotalea sp. Marseille-Q4924 TaxID=2866571 RepID=UPI001CE466CF|nr:hypothetical protein [Actinotalea sp. Marseille-Q4924]